MAGLAAKYDAAGRWLVLLGCVLVLAFQSVQARGLARQLEEERAFSSALAEEFNETMVAFGAAGEGEFQCASRTQP